MTAPEPDLRGNHTARSAAPAPDGAPALSIDDHLESRLRLPADGLRCVLACAEIALLAGVALLARATVSGVEANVVGASQLAGRKLPTGVLGLLGVLAHIVLLVLACPRRLSCMAR